MTSLLSSNEKARSNELLERGAGVTRVEIEVQGIAYEEVSRLLERISSALYDIDGLTGAVLTHTISQDFSTGGENTSAVHGRIAGGGLKPFGPARPWWEGSA